jgi:hypothetical protein
MPNVNSRNYAMSDKRPYFKTNFLMTKKTRRTISLPLRYCTKRHANNSNETWDCHFGKINIKHAIEPLTSGQAVYARRKPLAARSSITNLAMAVTTILIYEMENGDTEASNAVSN